MRIQELEDYPEIEDFVYLVFYENEEEPTQEALDDFLLDREPCVGCGAALVYCDDGDLCETCLVGGDVDEDDVE